MKLPVPDLRAVPDLLVRHGEKIVVTVVGLAGLWLVWGGVHALRSLTVKDTQTPEAVDRAATQARGHIERDAQPPADLLPPREPLARAIDPWRTPLVPWWTGTAAPVLTIAKPPVLAALDRPLFNELAKRSRPEVLPLEDLRAVAGVAVLPVTTPTAEPGGAAPRPPVAAPPAGKGTKPRAGRDPLAGGPEATTPDATAGAVPDVERRRIVPYVVVTALIPVKKQQEEYRRRFESTSRPSDHDLRRDMPLWCDFEIDRATVGPDGKETWTRLDLAAIDTKRATDWGADAAVGVPTEFLLGSGEDARSKQTTPIGFCAPLPRRLDGTWELADLHPWVAERLEATLAADRPEPAKPRQPVEALPDREGPGFDEKDQPPADQPPIEQPQQLPDYRLFRFIDTDVSPGTSYRYRVRLKVYNPNYAKNPEKMRPHLESPDLAIELKLASPESKPSPPAVVADPTRVVIGTLRRAEAKELRLKPGTLEVLVLAPSATTGSYALRGLIADPGAVLDIDEEINKRYRSRARGEKVVTDRLLLDARGRQDDRRDAPAEKEKTPGTIPEPLDVLCVRPDGSFELASLADSERPLDAYRDTLPARGTKADAKEPAPGDSTRPDVPSDQPVRPRVPF
ncbi:MAG: hypothetical protein ACKOSQ_07635 [Planctomycetaceae bacterium]